MAEQHDATATGGAEGAGADQPPTGGTKPTSEPTSSQAQPQDPRGEPPFSISPDTVTLGSRTAQRFEARFGDQHEPAEWSISPKRGSISAQQEVYTSPFWVGRSGRVIVTARAKGRLATAVVELSSLPFWTHFLGIYWVAGVVTLVVLIALLWTDLCPSCRLDVAVSPPIVTLSPGRTQHFTANVPVVWFPAMTPVGVYTAPPDLKADQVVNITASSSADPKKAGSAMVVNSPDVGLVIIPPMSTVTAGQPLDLLAIATGSTTPPTPTVVEFQSPTIGQLKVEAGTPSKARFTVDVNMLTTPTTVTILAATKGTPQRWAGAHVYVLPADRAAGSCTSCAPDCVGDTSRFLVLIALMGALGGVVHGISSFATYVGNRELRQSWTWWYVLKPLLGAGVALVVYLVYRAGFGGNDGLLSVVDCIKVGALAGLIGLFAESATLKLKDIFDTLFTPRQDPRGDKASTRPLPRIDRIDPSTLAKAPTWPVPLTLTGANFASACMVKIGASTKKPLSVSGTEVKFNLDKADVPDAETVTIAVSNAPPDGELSNSVSLRRV